MKKIPVYRPPSICKCSHWRPRQVEVEGEAENVYVCVSCGTPWLQGHRNDTALMNAIESAKVWPQIDVPLAVAANFGPAR